MLRRPSLALLLLLAPLGASAGPVFKYVEKDGTIVYTNVPPGTGHKARRLKGTFTPAPRSNAPPMARPRSADAYEVHIASASTRYRVPPALVRAVMHAESNFNPMAVSPKGASGLMQLMPETAREMFVRDIFDERENIEGGTRYLRVLANQFNGDMLKMVAAYNAGPEAVRKYKGAVPPYAETQAYVRKVLQLYYQYKREAETAEGDSR